MVQPHLTPEVYYGRLLKVKTPSGAYLYYQNFIPNETYSFLGNTYSWVPFDLISNSESLELSSDSLEISVANVEVVRNAIATHGSLTQSQVTLYTIFPDDSGSANREDTAEISHTSFQYGVIIFHCESVINAITGVIPSGTFNPVITPELAYYNSPNISPRFSR